MQRTAVILVLAVVVLGGLYFLTPRGGPSPEAPPASDLAFVLPEGPYAQVELKLRDGEVTWRLEGDRVVQTHPVRWPVEAERARGLLAALRTLTVVRDFGSDLSGEDRAAMALDAPPLRVRVTGGFGSAAVWLGDRTPTGTGYVETDAGRVVATPADLHDLLFRLRTTDALVDRVPLSVGPNTPVRLERADGDTAVVMTPGASSTRFADTGDRADADALRAALDATAAAGVAWPATSDAAALDRPRVVVNVGAGEDAQRLVLGRPADLTGARVYARFETGPPGETARASPVFTLPAAVAAAWDRPRDQWRPAALFPVEPARVTNLRIERGGDVLLDADPALPSTDASAPQPADALAGLLALRAAAFRPGFTSTDEPVATVALTLGLAGTDTLTARIYALADALVAIRDDEPTGYALDPATLPPWLRGRFQADPPSPTP